MRAKVDLELESGRGGGPYFDALKELRAGIRTQVAALLGVSDDHLALTTSTTHGCQIVLAGLGIAPGDEIVTTDEEHFGLLGPVHASGATVRVAHTRGETRGACARRCCSRRSGRARASSPSPTCRG